MGEPQTLREAAQAVVGRHGPVIQVGPDEDEAYVSVAWPFVRALRAALNRPDSLRLDPEDLRGRIETNLRVYERRIERGTGTDLDRGKVAGLRVALALLDPTPPAAFSCPARHASGDFVCWCGEVHDGPGEGESRD